jgi:hypothetical protein
VTRGGLLALLVASSSALAHPQGVHVKLTFTLTRVTVTGLLVMDIDSGQRCLLLREAADENRDGFLDAAETKRLEQRLVHMATRNLKLFISGAAVPVVVKETKLSLRNDKRANDTGFSLAVLTEVTHPHQVDEGMAFQVENVTPDLSPTALEVFQPGEPVTQAELESGKRVSVRLGNAVTR